VSAVSVKAFGEAAPDSGADFKLKEPTRITMKQSMLLSITFVNWMLCAAHSATLGTAFTYQGRLADAGNPANGVYDLRFTIYDSTNSPGTVIAGPLTNAATSVSNGLFTATLDFGASVFDGNARWLEIAVQTNGAASFTPLSPRQLLTPTPYAIQAAKAASLVSFPNAPLDLTVNGQRALRLESSGFGAPNVIRGSEVNLADAGVVGATIAGGGALNYAGYVSSNRVSANFGTIGGGFLNLSAGFAATVGGGDENVSSANYATVAGGRGNISSNGFATVAGGDYNTSGGLGATVAGGRVTKVPVIARPWAAVFGTRVTALTRPSLAGNRMPPTALERPWAVGYKTLAAAARRPCLAARPTAAPLITRP